MRAWSRRTVLAAGASTAAAAACRAQPAREGLAAIAARRGVVFGAAIEPDPPERDPAFAALLRHECASLTVENHLKWNILRPAPDRFDFRGIDRVLAIAAAQGAQVHGHCLLWHEANPDWLVRALDPQNAQRLLEHHIGAVVSRLAGRVQTWDVVNEGVERNDRRPDGLRRSLWLEALGPDYIPLAFEAAHRMDPSARLAFSDYGFEYEDSWMREKRGTMLELLAGWKRAGVPIHALGIQGHLRGDRPPAYGMALRRFVADVGKLGLEVWITELDVDDQKVPGSVEQRDLTVAAHYRAFLDMVLAEPAVRRVTTWGLCDRYTSKTDMFPRADGQPVRPLPFDRDLRRKPAWYAMVDAFSG